MKFRNSEKNSYFSFLIIFLLVFVIHILVSWQKISEVIVKTEKKKKPLKVTYKVIDKSKQKKQIVNNTKVRPEAKPKDSSFLSNVDQKVEKQTIAKNVGSYNVGGKGSKQENNEDQSMSSSKTKMTKKVSLKDLMIRPEDVSGIKKVAKVKKSKKGDPNSERKGSGLTQSNDYIKDMELGDLTALNSIKFKYFGFYERIRKKLEQYWGASIREKAKKLFHRGGRMPASKDYITSLKIILDKQGKIVGINIQGSSGIKDLDDAAVESFNQAGPFPNPPKGLLKGDVAVIEWGFVVKG